MKIRFVTLSLLIYLAGLAGCGSSDGLPSELPSLPEPPSAPKRVPITVVSIRMDVLNGDGKPAKELHSQEPCQVRVTFRLPPDSKALDQLTVQIGRESRTHGFVVHDENSGPTNRNSLGEYESLLKLRSPTEPEKYAVQVVFSGQVMLKEAVNVLAPRKNQ